MSVCSSPPSVTTAGYLIQYVQAAARNFEEHERRVAELESGESQFYEDGAEATQSDDSEDDDISGDEKVP